MREEDMQNVVAVDRHWHYVKPVHFLCTLGRWDGHGDAWRNSEMVKKKDKKKRVRIKNEYAPCKWTGPVAPTRRGSSLLPRLWHP